MSRFTIEKAVRRGNKARVALAAPAGGGKTFTALTLAIELAKGGDILVIDTERGSASLYADQFDFQVIQWSPPFDPAELAKVIAEVAPSFAVLVIDSLSHFWMGEGGTLDVVDAAGARASGNKFAGWKAGTPVQNDMVDAMLTAPCHVIATMRSKMEFVQEKDGGRTVIRKVGMAPVQRDGIEYEFTVTADLDTEHLMVVGKTRCSALAGKSYKAGHAADMGKALAEWLEGAEAEAPARPPLAPVPDEPAHELADDWDRQSIGTMVEALDEEHRAMFASRWKESGLPPSKHPDFTKAHVAAALKMLGDVKDEADATYDRRRKHVNAKMGEVGVKTDSGRHDLMRHATDGRTESSKRLTQTDVDEIVAYCAELAAADGADTAAAS